MKYLSDYIEEAQTKILDEMGAFWAFGQGQVDAQKKEGVEYVSLGNGLICPKDNAKALSEGLAKIADEGIKTDLAENGKKGVIHRELGNHEYSITFDITDTASALYGYDITDDEIRAETGAYMEAFNKWEEEQERHNDI